MSQKVYVIKAAGMVGFICGQVMDMCSRAIARGPIEIILRRPKRSLEQNNKLWALLTDVSKQVEWYGQKMAPEDWKHVFTASLTKQRAVPGIDGGFVVLGVSTRDKPKEWFSDLFQVIYAFGSEKGVIWSDPNEADEVGKVAGGRAAA